MNNNAVWTIAPTAFTPDGAIDFESMANIIAWYDNLGVQGITILGVMGEANKLTAQESLEIIKIFKKLATCQIIVGITNPSLATMAELSKHAMDLGCDGVMIAPPNHLRTDDAICGYYRDAIKAIGTDIPVCVQDFPLNFSVQMSLNVLKRLISENPSVNMLKHEDWPGLEKLSQLKSAMNDKLTREIPIFCGNGGMFLDWELRRGANGPMTGYAYPELLCAMVKLHASGDYDKMHQLFNIHLPLIRYEQQSNIGLAVRKFIMASRGMIKHDTMRAPCTPLSPTAQKEIITMMNNITTQSSKANIL